MNQLKRQEPKLLIIGKGGKKEGMGHLVRIGALVETLAPNYLFTVLVKQDHFGEFFFKQKGIDCFTYRDNRGLYLFLEKTTRTGKYAVIIIDIYRISINVIKRIENYCDFLDKTVNLHAVMGFDPGEIHNQSFSSRVHIGKNVDNMVAFITGMDVGIIAGGFIKFGKIMII